jgi:hypothetical protein
MGRSVSIWTKIGSSAGKVKSPLPERSAIKVVNLQVIPGLNVAGLAGKFNERVILTEVRKNLARESDGLRYNISRPSAGNVPGALLQIDYSKPGAIPFLVIGDLHGNEKNLNRILKLYGAQIDRGEIGLLFLGDALHPETGDVLDMASSLRVLKSIIALKQHYPDRVHYLLGNHDLIYTSEQLLAKVMDYTAAFPLANSAALAKMINSDPQVEKNEINKPMMILKGENNYQAFEFIRYLISEMRTQRVVEEQIRETLKLYQAFFDGCPLALAWEGDKGTGLAAHVPVIRDGVTREELVNARANPPLQRQLLWNRYKDDNEHTAFREKDIKSTAVRVGIMAPNKEVNLVGGHTPDRLKGKSIYEVGDRGLILPKYPANVRSLIVHSSMEDPNSLLLEADGTLTEIKEVRPPAGRGNLAAAF